MTPALASRCYLRPVDVAQTLGVNESKILGWIRNGELRGVNVAQNRNGRPRWRVSQEALDAFLLARSATPTPKPPRRRRRQRDTGIIEFF
jgi:excisionase family DNA binding protein